MKLKKSVALGMVTLFTLSTLAACGGSGTKTDDSKAASDEKVSGEQVFRINERSEMPSADLSLATDEVSFNTLANSYEGIYRLDKDSQPQPAGAAEKAEVSEDGLVYKVKLNEKSIWTDGKPVKAADYVYGWQRTVDPATASEYASLFGTIKNAQEIIDGKKDKAELGIKATGDFELEITLDQATPYMDYLLAFPSFFPQRQDIVEKYGKEFAAASDKAVYNGPFVLADFEGPGTDTEWSLKKNKEYWDKETVKLDEVKISVVKEAPTSLNLFQDGQVDQIILTGELAQQMADDPEFLIGKEASTTYIELNQREANSVFKNENLRKAISYSIDRKALVEQILADGSIEPKGLVPADMSANPTTGKDFAGEAGNVLKFDKAKAKDYWEKAKKELGIKTLEMDILASDSDVAKKMIEYLQGAIQETLEGVKVTVSPVPFSVRLDRSNKGDFTTVLSGWGADYADPSSFLNLFETGNPYNRGHYSNGDYDKNIKEAGSTNANDPEKRWENLLEAEKIIMDDMGLIPVYQRAQAFMRAEKVKGVVFHPAGPNFDFKWAYISE